uniref:Uncharacterized protein n=1 Tax=Vespula pensylvanica TaxID=30213 RepID=A0A834NK97_VESPE|nr:hypothetical protein H0235_013205 [Vespula pensylvanica]
MWSVTTTTKTTMRTTRGSGRRRTISFYRLCIQGLTIPFLNSSLPRSLPAPFELPGEGDVASTSRYPLAFAENFAKTNPCIEQSSFQLLHTMASRDFKAIGNSEF